MVCIATTDLNEGCFHAAIDSNVYTFLHEKPHNFPVIPPQDEVIDPSYNASSLPNFYNPTWVTEKLPFLGFAPSSNPFKCTFLRCLNYSFEMLPIDMVEGKSPRFQLRLSLMKEWDSLERNMRSFLHACMRVNRLPTYGFRLWSYPAYFGYMRRWPTVSSARQAAYRSRQAFIPLIASISFFLHLLYSMGNKWEKIILNDRLRVDLPLEEDFFWNFWSERQKEVARFRRGPVPSKWEWKSLLQEETKISWEWLSYFEEEVLKIPMVGLFMDVSKKSGCINWLPVFLEAAIPVVLYWGHSLDFSTSLSRVSAGLFPMPNRVIVDDLVSRQALYHPEVVPPAVQQIPIANAPYAVTSGQMPATSVANPIRTSTSIQQLCLPRITGGTQPRPNEDIFAFLKRREDARASFITGESASQRQMRLSREENAEKDRPPGKKGARVYYWDLRDGKRVRSAAGRSNYEDLWERYGPRQRRYDSVADEWDVCTDLDPSDIPIDMDVDDFEDSDNDYTAEVAEELSDPIQGAASSAAYIDRLHLNEDTHNVRMNFQDAIDEVAYFRFGFRMPSPGTTEERTIVFREDVWVKVLAMLGSSRLPRPPVRQNRSEHVMCSFFFQLLKAESLQNAPHIYDLTGQEGPNVKASLGVSFIHCIDGDNYFIIQPVEDVDAAFLIGLKSAGSVLEIVRRKWGPKNNDVVKALLHHGIAFNTLVVGDPLQQRKAYRRRRYAMLGVRPSTFVPGLGEYKAYELRRNELFRSARGRAALLAGGIIARLARDVANEEDVFDGPTEDAMESILSDRSLCVWDGSEEYALWDDKLTDEETELICGMYEFEIGKSLDFVEVFSFSFQLFSEFTRSGFQILVAKASGMESIWVELWILVQRR